MVLSQQNLSLGQLAEGAIVSSNPGLVEGLKQCPYSHPRVLVQYSNSPRPKVHAVWQSCFQGGAMLVSSPHQCKLCCMNREGLQFRPGAKTCIGMGHQDPVQSAQGNHVFSGNLDSCDVAVHTRP